MKTEIYYFSGTGNSLYIARLLAESLPDTKLIDIAGMKDHDVVNMEAGKIGFVFPVYFYGIPRIVEDFINKIVKHREQYCFTVVTAMYPNGFALEQMKERLEKKNITLNSGFYIQMPNNYIITREADSEKAEKRKVKKARLKVEKIVPVIKENRSNSLKESRLYNMLMGSRKRYSTWYTQVRSLDKNFCTGPECTQCGVCVKKCPVQNISLTDSGPVWHHSCEECLRCLHICPVRTIEYGTTTAGKKRYTGKMKLLSAGSKKSSL